MNKKVLVGIALVLAIFVLVPTSETQQDDYLVWKQKFGQSFTHEEDSFRRLIFLKNLDIIEKHNKDSTQTYKMGINQFSALTDEEFQKTFLNPRPNPNLILNEDVDIVPINADIDWTAKGMVSPVKNQGSCGSCWAFSAVGIMESWSLMKGKSVNLSEQQLVDCSKKYGNQGCNGGFNYQGLAYVKDHGIIATSSYPYVAKTQTSRHAMLPHPSLGRCFAANA